MIRTIKSCIAHIHIGDEIQFPIKKYTFKGFSHVFVKFEVNHKKEDKGGIEKKTRFIWSYLFPPTTSREKSNLRLNISSLHKGRGEGLQNTSHRICPLKGGVGWGVVDCPTQLTQIFMILHLYLSVCVS